MFDIRFKLLSLHNLKLLFVMLEKLVKYVLPCEIVDYFELVSIKEEASILHLYLDEKNKISSAYQGIELFSNGFYAESTIKDFPLRDKKVVLHVRRRRWVDKEGKSYSNDWHLTAEGTRYSIEFASFLKAVYGYLPHNSPIP
jgi:hypothetical protein